MGKNNRPILSVLVEEEKKKKFAALAERYTLSMGWLLNQAIDKMLEADSIHVYRDSIEPTEQPNRVIEPIEDIYVKKSDFDNVLMGYVPRDDLDEIFADRKHDLLKNTINHVTLNKALEAHPDKWQFEELQKAVDALGAKLAALGQVAQTSTTPPGKLSLEGFVAKFPRKPLEVNPSWSLIKREDLNTKHGVDIQLGDADRVRYQLYLHDLLYYPDELLGRYFFKSNARSFYDTQPEGVTND
jgi:hypothetical protein